PGDVVDTEVGTVDGDQRLAKVAEARLVALHDARLDQHHSRALAVVELADRIDALVALAHAPCRLARHRGLGDQVADRRIPARKLDPGLLADHAATAVTADEVL